MKFIVVTLVAALTLGLLAASLAAEAQQAGKVYRIGFLLPVSREPAEHLLQAFEQALRERGWVRGQNLVIEYRPAEGKYDRLQGLAAELARLEPQVIVAVATAAARAAKDATSKIPIVMVNAIDPIGEGLIASFARPGGNVTGLTFLQRREMYAKQLQLLKETVPRARRIAVLWNPTNPTASATVSTVEQAARALGVEVQVVGARAPEEFEPAFRAMAQARADAPPRLLGLHALLSSRPARRPFGQAPPAHHARPGRECAGGRPYGLCSQPAGPVSAGRRLRGPAPQRGQPCRAGP